MGERIAFEDLTTELANVRARVDSWAYNKMAEADDSVSTYQRKMIDQKGRFALYITTTMISLGFDTGLVVCSTCATARNQAQAAGEPGGYFAETCAYLTI